MCIIALKFKGKKLPKVANLLECGDKNKDGMGVAYLKDGTQEVVIKKDFVDNDDFIKWLYDNIKEEDTCVIHYRYATHGLKDEGNRHPFPITNNKELLRKTNIVCNFAVAHNGVISSYGAHKKYSDTQKLVYDILADDVVKNNLDNPTVQKLINNFLGGDRLAILTSDGTVYTWGEWVEFEDIFYSNTGYKVYEYASKTIWDKWGKNNNYEGICDCCGANKSLKEIDGEYGALLCKSCRKQYNKGKLKFNTETFVFDVVEGKGVIDVEMTALEKKSITDSQCESCLEWKPTEEIVNYYNHKICKTCSQDAVYNNNN